MSHGGRNPTGPAALLVEARLERRLVLCVGREAAAVEGTSLVEGPTMERRTQAHALVAAALADVEAELASPTRTLCPVQLGTCRDTLKGYLAELDAGTLPPKRERTERLGRMIADSWPYDAPLGPVVIRAERAWRNA